MSAEQEANNSIHGESAARRQAITELLFFASVGDLVRCNKICHTWKLNPKDATCCDYDKRTALHLAASEGCYTVAQWLLEEMGCSPNPVDRFKRTPLEDAMRSDHGDVAALIAQKGGKVMSKHGELIDLAESPLSLNVRIFGEYDPEWEIDMNSLKIMDKIGEGEFGTVFKAKWQGTLVAVKVLKDANAMALGDFRTELNVLQKVHHPHTVQFFGAVTKQRPYMIVTEFMRGGSLADMFQAGAYPSMTRAVQLAAGTAKGMAYLHNRNPQQVIHRDLKPANLMIGGHRVLTPAHRHLMYKETGIIKIADFGLSKSVKLNKAAVSRVSMDGGGSALRGKGEDLGSNDPKHSSVSYKMTGETGSYRYMAPEVFRHEPYNSKVDVYAFSMICFQLFEGMPPFWMLDPVDAARKASTAGLRPEWGTVNRWGAKVPPALKALVESCWAADYDERPTFDEIVEVLEAELAKLPAEKSVMNGDQCCAVA